MNDEFTSITRSQILATIGVVAFTWGSLWAGSQAVKITFDNSSNTSNLAAVAPVSNKSATQTPSPSPLQASNNSSINSSSVANPNPSPDSNSVSILMGGDVMFDRGVRMLGQKHGYDSLLTNVAPLFKKSDLAIVNLEGPITSNDSKTYLANGKYGTDLIFTSPPESATTLANAGVGFVSLANNHMDNFGMSGFNETKKYLSDAGVQYFGDPWNDSATEKTFTKNGVTVALVGYHEFQKGFDRIVSDVKRLHALGDFVIVMPHWGVEYSSKPTDKMRGEAKVLVAAGANAIIGSHPHVIGEHEWIGEVPVFYSLGNLLFDQYFSADVMKGNLIKMTVSPGVDSPHLDHIEVYNTSLASKKGVEVDPSPVDFSK